jgi:hypothetical protein
LVALLAVGAVVLVVVSNPRSSDSRCVGGRVAVKTLADGDDVEFTPVPAQIGKLRHLRRPGRLRPGRRSIPVEATTFQINARLLAMRRRSNDSIDLFVSAPTRPSLTMIVGFEGSRICGHRAVTREEGSRKVARQTLIAACGEPGRRRLPLAGTAEISGVGFFGDKGGQGAAPNGIELHPAIHFKSSDCRKGR